MKQLIIRLLIIAAVAALLSSCASYRCYPSKKSRDYARRATIVPVKNGYLVTERNGFVTTSKIYACWPIPDSIQ